MPAGRFLVSDLKLAVDGELELPLEVAHQVRDVLRLGPGDTIHLLDGAGGEYDAMMVELTRRGARVRIGKRHLGTAAEHVVPLVLCLGMLKAAKFELVLQKGTELGVRRFIPLVTERAVAASESTGVAKRSRWRRITAEAIEQCGGTVLPEIAEPITLHDALQQSRAERTIGLLPWEEEHTLTLRAALHGAAGQIGGLSRIVAVYLFVGPEGGFSRAEAAEARDAGVLPVTLGPRILRAETAALVATTLALDALGALGQGPTDHAAHPRQR